MSEKKNQSAFYRLQERLERHLGALLLMIAFVLSIGGIVEIVPLFYLKDTLENERVDTAGNARFPELMWQRTIEEGKSDKRLYYQAANGSWASDWKPGDGIRPLNPLELAGRDVYQREGCMACHSLQIRTLHDEQIRYGHYSLAAESQYNHPHLWGSKRTGPDLARVGGKYSDFWHIIHLRNPQSVIPESVMPQYPWLEERAASDDVYGIKRDMTNRLSALRTLGVPYTQIEVDNANKMLEGKTEMDAIVAFLQSLGNMAKLDPNVDYRN